MRVLLWLAGAALGFRFLIWGWMGLIDIPTEREQLARWAENRFRGAAVRIHGLDPSIDWRLTGRLELRDLSVEHPNGDFILAEPPWNYLLDLPRLNLEMPVRQVYAGDGGQLRLTARGGRLAVMHNAFGEWSLAGLGDPAPPGESPDFPFGTGRAAGAELDFKRCVFAFLDESSGFSLEAALAGVAHWRRNNNSWSGALRQGKWTIRRGRDGWEGSWSVPLWEASWTTAPDDGRRCWNSGRIDLELDGFPLAAGVVLGAGWPAMATGPLYSGRLSLRDDAPDGAAVATADGGLSGLGGPFFAASTALPVAAEWRSSPRIPNTPEAPDDGGEAGGGSFHIDIDGGGWVFDGKTADDGRVVALDALVKQIRLDEFPRDLSRPPAWLAWLYAQQGVVTVRAAAATVEGWPLGPMTINFHHEDATPATVGAGERAPDRVLHGRAQTRLLGGAVLSGEAGPWWPGRRFAAYRVEAQSLPIAPFLGLWRSRMPEAVRPVITGGSATISLRYVPTAKDMGLPPPPSPAATSPEDTRDTRDATDMAGKADAAEEAPEWEVVLDAGDVTVTIPTSGSVWKTLADTDAGLLAAQLLVDNADAAAGKELPPRRPAAVGRPLAGLTFPTLVVTYTRFADGRERIRLRGHCWELGALNGEVRRSRDGSLSIGAVFTDVPAARWRTVPGLSTAVREAAARLGAADGPGWRFDFVHELGKPTAATPTYVQTIFRETR